jgi:hypothetical protein
MLDDVLLANGRFGTVPTWVASGAPSPLQALLGCHDEARWIRYARKAVVHLFPYLPEQPGYNKRLRRSRRSSSSSSECWWPIPA